MKYMKQATSLFFLTLFSTSALASNSDKKELTVDNMCDNPHPLKRPLDKVNWLCTQQSRLSAYQPNSAAWEITEDDKSALEVNFSFRYLITRPDCYFELEYDKNEALSCINSWDNRSEWFFSYTGKFDFYVGTRSSGPVINRKNNPALHWRSHEPTWLPWLGNKIKWIDLALEHRSNGQITEYDALDRNGNMIAERAWLLSDRAYIDSISRAANYFSAEILKKDYVDDNTSNSYYLKAKAYFDDESLVTWGSRKNENDRIWDYDVFRLIFSQTKRLPNNTYFKQIEWDVEYTVGMKGFDTDSLNASIYLPLVSKDKRIVFPINYFKIHLGPMNELSNYTEPQNSFFFGFKFNPMPKF